MLGYIPRILENYLKEEIEDYPILAILGPRQCGKSTLVQEFGKSIEKFLYIDLENPSDRQKLTEPQLFFENYEDHCICLDEIQRMPEVFTILRSWVDRKKRNGQFILLGSASPELLKQSSESLAGRISFLELNPFIYPEILNGKYNRNDFWMKGGFPGSYLTVNDKKSFRWRENFTSTFLERDIPQLGIKIPSGNIRNLWTLCAHNHGSLLNYNKLGQSLGLSYNTIKNYIMILEKTYMVRILSPYIKNVKKRLVKSEKIYIRDSGILHYLLSLKEFSDLLGHTVLGASWEGFVIENILNTFTDSKGYFYRTSAGAEIDFIWEYNSKRIAIECKASKTPVLSRGFWNAMEDLEIEEAYVISPIDLPYPLEKRVTVTSLENFIMEKMKKI
ncbi:MAG: ATP-binding protein [Leptospiraceae bacterium]|nr:ATP-binding protein [Leptospiraceae bacterium]